MENMVELIVNGAEGFTPEVLVRLMVFCLVLECIGSIANSIFRAGGRY